MLTGYVFCTILSSIVEHLLLIFSCLFYAFTITIFCDQIVLEADGYQPNLISPEKGLKSLIKGVLRASKRTFAALCWWGEPELSLFIMWHCFQWFMITYIFFSLLVSYFNQKSLPFFSFPTLLIDFSLPVTSIVWYGFSFQYFALVLSKFGNKIV